MYSGELLLMTNPKEGKVQEQNEIRRFKKKNREKAKTELQMFKLREKEEHGLKFDD